MTGPWILRMVPALVVMGTIFFLSATPGDEIHLPPFPYVDKLAHMSIYGLLGLSLLFALQPRWRQAHRVGALLFAVLFSLLYGVSDEFHQSFVPGRSPDVFDLVADGCGAFLCCAFALFMGHFVLAKER